MKNPTKVPSDTKMYYKESLVIGEVDSLLGLSCNNARAQLIRWGFPPALVDAMFLLMTELTTKSEEALAGYILHAMRNI